MKYWFGNILYAVRLLCLSALAGSHCESLLNSVGLESKVIMFLWLEWFWAYCTVISRTSGYSENKGKLLKLFIIDNVLGLMSQLKRINIWHISFCRFEDVGCGNIVLVLKPWEDVWCCSFYDLMWTEIPLYLKS